MGEKTVSSEKMDPSITQQVQLWKIDKVVYCDSYCISLSSTTSGDRRNHLSMQENLSFPSLHLSRDKRFL